MRTETEAPAPPDATAVAETEPALPIDCLAGVPASLGSAIRRRGYSSLTSVQHAVLGAESDGRDLRISSQTGSGKTVAIGFALAAELLGERPSESGAAPSDGPKETVPGRSGPSVLVLVPTRELAMQVRDELAWLFEEHRNLGIAVVMGGTSVGLERRALSRNPRVVVGTPGRALDHLRRGALAVDGIRHVVLDEADRMLDMGFREELEAILEGMPAERRTHLVSATFSGAVRSLANRFQKDALQIEGTALGAANRDIEHVGHVVARHDVHGAVVNLLLLNEGKRCLIFVERRVDATALADQLSADGFAVQAFSGELAQAQRTRTINAFKEGSIKTLVSTDVAARGLDVPDIELVIHAGTPESADAYVHRSGRTGRAGSTGRSVMLVNPRARRTCERLLASARIEAQWKPVPSAARVNRELRKRFRQHVHQRLAAEDPPSQEHVDYAKGLLDGREPAEVVAMLLEMAQPKMARAAVDVREPSEPVRGPRGRGPRAKGKARPDGRGKPGDSREYVTFSVNWGGKTGAATARVLGHVCRRGQIKSQLVGTIDIDANTTRFEVDASVAERFEKAVKRPDPRDSELEIVRAEAASTTGRKGGSDRLAKKLHARSVDRPRGGRFRRTSGPRKKG